MVSWEQEGRNHYSTVFHWEPEGRYHCTKSMAIVPFWSSRELCWTALMPFLLSLYKIYAMAIVPFWFSTEHCWTALMPFWLPADDMSMNVLTDMCDIVSAVSVSVCMSYGYWDTCQSCFFIHWAWRMFWSCSHMWNVRATGISVATPS